MPQLYRYYVATILPLGCLKVSVFDAKSGAKSQCYFSLSLLLSWHNPSTELRMSKNSRHPSTGSGWQSSACLPCQRTLQEFLCFEVFPFDSMERSRGLRDGEGAGIAALKLELVAKVGEPQQGAGKRLLVGKIDKWTLQQPVSIYHSCFPAVVVLYYQWH